jgi:hypothetical protein
MMGEVESRLCPKCGAYWRCDCVIDPQPPRHLSPAPRRSGENSSRLTAPQPAETPGCQHDWTEVVGVELDADASLEEAQVLVCRLCGLYAVEKTA